MSRWRGQGGFRAAFFHLALWCALGTAGAAARAALPQTGDEVTAIQALAHAQRLADAPVWAALLHLDRGRPTIGDAGFLLSMPRFSARAELDATIAALYGPRSLEWRCRFPARHAWLSRQLPVPDSSLTHCKDLQEFLRRAPADRISLVFASENLAQPSSMMGHLFLKVEGRDATGAPREHAISFFTDAATFNLPKLLFDSLVVGKQGYFALSPYAEDLEQYLTREQRTLWEYELALDTEQRQLLRYHLIELKQSSFTYFFHRHNCATLIKHIVAIASPGMLGHPRWIDTPKDIVKLADQADIIATTTVRAPARWRIKAIDAVLPATRSRRVRQEVAEHRTDFLAQAGTASREGYLSLELASAYNEYLRAQGDRGQADWRSYRDTLERLRSDSFAGYAVEATPGKDPVTSPAESQWRVGWKHQRGHRFLTVGVLPVSHTLADDNRQYFGENELRLFDAGLTVDMSSGRVGLERFTVYAARSMLPRDRFTGGWSGQFKVGWEPQPGRALEDRTALVLEGGLGITSRPLPDVDVYAIVSAGLGVRQQAYAYVHPTVGVVVREVHGMKSQLTTSYIDRPLGRDDGVTEVAFTQSKYLDGGLTLVLQASRRLAAGGRQSDTVSATVKRLF
ncbi:MAG: DUF4105 domain-containing protein [Rubrivivax sp.]|nr:MAG: DUF4105 domain-containing protein [Rubrivivax sp.]